MSTTEDVITAAPGPAPGERSGQEPADSGAGRRGGIRFVLAAALALLLGGTVLLHQERQLTHTPATTNQALTDTETTAEITGDISNALTEIFSYTPTDTAATRTAAGELLRGRAARQYAELFGQVEKQAARQKLTLTTHVVRAGVKRLDDGSAQLLVFLDQVSERPGRPPATAPAQLSVTAERHDGHWRITDIAAR